MIRLDLPGDAYRRSAWKDIERPDWVIIGGPLPDGTGVALLASKTLTSARLHALATDKVYLGQMTMGWAKTGVFLALDVCMDDYVMAAGADYFEALEALHFLLPDFKPARSAVAVAEVVAELEAAEAAAKEPMCGWPEGGPRSIEAAQVVKVELPPYGWPEDGSIEWEYATTTGPRKAWDAADTPPSGEGWERDRTRRPEGWERFEYHEESYWRRPLRPVPESEE